MMYKMRAFNLHALMMVLCVGYRPVGQIKRWRVMEYRGPLGGVTKKETHKHRLIP